MTAIRPGVFRLGETVEIAGTFELNAIDIRVTIRKPPPDNGMLGPFPLPLIDGEAIMDFDPDIVGTWKVRLECRLPKRSVTESKFEVVPQNI